MSELTFNREEFEAFISDAVPGYQRGTVVQALDLNANEERRFDEIGLSLTGERQNISFICYTAAPQKAGASMWCHIKSEIYDYICTNSKKYTKERNEAQLTVRNTVTIIATAVASQYNVAMGVITGAVTVGMISALKIGKNAWCAANKPVP